jgi:hypothetical protein
LKYAAFSAGGKDRKARQGFKGMPELGIVKKIDFM